MDTIATQAANIDFEKLLNYLGSARFWVSIAIVVAAFIIWHIIKRVRKKFRKKNGGENTTASHVIFDIGRFLFFFILIIVLLQVNGINVTALVTGLGVVSIVIGFALQDFLKDIIMGVHILTDNFFQVGDVVRYNDKEGVVISYNIRTTKLRLVEYKEIMTICNRNISEIQVISDMFDLDVDLPYFVEAKKIHDAMLLIAEKASGLENVKKCVYKGANSFNQSSITYRLRYFTEPDERRMDVRRAIIKVVYETLKEHGIPFPYNHLENHLI